MMKKWKHREADYRYIDEQFRSMRQDLTVQRIQSDTAAKVSLPKSVTACLDL